MTIDYAAWSRTMIDAMRDYEQLDDWDKIFHFGNGSSRVYGVLRAKIELLGGPPIKHKCPWMRNRRRKHRSRKRF